MQISVDLYLLSLVTERSPYTIDWYRKRLAPLRTTSWNISSIALPDLQELYQQLATRQIKYLDHPSRRAPVSGPLSPATLRGYVRAWRAFFNWCAAWLTKYTKPCKLEEARRPTAGKCGRPPCGSEHPAPARG